jgi:hypothetical protein
MVANTTLQAIRDRCFPQQLSFIRDSSKRKALFVGRRAGKSTAIAIYFILAALTNPGVRLTYFGLTAGSAEDTMHPIMLGPQGILTEFLQLHEYSYNNTEHLIQFNNGASIKFAGCDVSYKEINKVLGSKQYMICIDECQDQGQDLERIINKKAQECVSDYLDQGGGQIILAGTAGDFMGSNYWYLITKQDDYYQPAEERLKGWSVHEWQHMDNPHMLKQKQIEQQNFLKELGPHYIDTNWWQQQYLNRWLKNSSSRVYNYVPANCQLLDIPLLTALNTNGRHKGKLFTYILATDLGHDDSCAFTLAAYHPYEPYLFFIKSEKHQAMSLDALKEKLYSYKLQYPIAYWPIDSAGSGKLIVEDYRQKLSINFEYPKSKTAKHDFIALMNSEFICSKIKVIETQCQPLIEEWNTVMLDKKALEKGFRKEADRYHNDCCDSALYSFAAAHYYRGKEQPIVHQVNHSEFFYQVQKQDRKRDLALSKKQGKWQQLANKETYK